MAVCGNVSAQADGMCAMAGTTPGTSPAAWAGYAAPGQRSPPARIAGSSRATMSVSRSSVSSPGWRCPCAGHPPRRRSRRRCAPRSLCRRGCLPHCRRRRPRRWLWTRRARLTWTGDMRSWTNRCGNPAVMRRRNPGPAALGIRFSAARWEAPSVLAVVLRPASVRTKKPGGQHEHRMAPGTRTARPERRPAHRPATPPHR